ncbi:alpha/beta hydrolase [Novosphingobium mangrovi (ex Hu et al. 2023)]|uniref:Alpha/beta hydrolase n=1 Tax=Novosphingobium mangrovi (ex Hu et al. 2023) TaxID=2930094 RepID=A0ABT0ABJ0_9SPHN|nr:alpha/beta hydrolase [Novosphingobium mangrovi (ex Hu et al. 2023)]MCJ1960529.1 alpha/beta hydrolase [Novosphingobium mangrovi (ex Hu et al. 2023)]
MPATFFQDDDVDPEIRDWLSQMFAASAALGSRPGLEVAQMRAIAERQREPWRRAGPVMYASEELHVGPHALRVRIHRPVAEDVLPVLVYLHGGGWSLFSIDTHDRLMREYAARAGIAVLGLDYRLAPENPFPAAIEDVAEVLAWLDTEGPAHGLDPVRYALGGDSAGANLALCGTLERRAAGKPLPRAMLLNYGAFDRAERPSYERYGDGERYMLTAPEMADFWTTYLGAGAVQDPRALPMLADLGRLAPAWLCIAQCDVLLDENLEMARRLAEAGNPVESRVYEGATHSFLEAVAASSLADRAIAEASEWLAKRLK